MGLMDKICESDPKDKYGNVRHATFMASQNWYGEDLYRLAENGHVVVRQELGQDDDRVRWLTANKWTEGYEADCPFKDGLMILITDKARIRFAGYDAIFIGNRTEAIKIDRSCCFIDG